MTIVKLRNKHQRHMDKLLSRFDAVAEGETADDVMHVCAIMVANGLSECSDDEWKIKYDWVIAIIKKQSKEITASRRRSGER